MWLSFDDILVHLKLGYKDINAHKTEPFIFLP
jgi:hypothetical protein